MIKFDAKPRPDPRLHERVHERPAKAPHFHQTVISCIDIVRPLIQLIGHVKIVFSKHAVFAMVLKWPVWIGHG